MARHATPRPILITSCDGSSATADALLKRSLIAREVPEPASRPKLRVATRREARRLAAFHVDAWRESYAGILPTELLDRLSVEQRAAQWLRILRGCAEFSDAAVYIAESSGRVVGFGLCCRQRDRALREMGFDGEICAIYVAKPHQGRGLGARITRKMAEVLKRRDCTGLALWVLRENAAARKFYESHGARAVAEKREKKLGIVLTQIAYGWPNLVSLI